MSDTEHGDEVPQTTTEETTTVVEEKKELTLMGALQTVLKTASFHDGLAKGLREACRSIVRDKPYFVVLADNCTEKQYKDLINALCREKKIDIISVPDQKELGQWVGLVRYDKQMKVKKQIKCSCLVVRDPGEPSEEFNFILNDLQSRHKE
jgi:small subunit ribosomal protein S12e